MPRVPADASVPQSSPVPHEPALDGLRGVAVLLVFVFHYGGGLSSQSPLIHALGLATEAGWTGVVLFFTLSGFLITGGLWDSMQTLPVGQLLRNFYARRALRILPVYWITLLLAVAGSLLRGASLRDLRPFALFVLFLQNIPGFTGRALNNPSPFPLYHLWSIAVEEQYYLIWPALLLLTHLLPAPRRSAAAKVLCMVLFAVSLLFRMLLVLPQAPAWIRQPALFHETLPVYAGSLALGAALALWMRGTAEASKWKLSCTLGLAGALLYVGTSIWSGNFYLESPLQLTLGLAGVSFTCAALISTAMLLPWLRALLATRMLVGVGRVSYSFYVVQVLSQPLVHRIGLELVHTSSGNLYFGLRFVIALGLSLAAATFSFYCIERPVLSWKQRFPMHAPLPD